MGHLETEREKFSRDRLVELSGAVAPELESILGELDLCVYATGSFGRLEAWEGSDADLFLLYNSSGDEGKKISKLLKLRVYGRLIEALSDLNFPKFDADGRFLEIHDLFDMRQALGSDEDDGVNAFTARMLLLLESRPVYNEAVYSDLLSAVVSFYFEDHEDHGSDFEPFFLLNDILRFWRTLTLNYEHDRHRRQVQGESADSDAVEKSALKNYKLKFSRLMTCFSMVAWLASVEGPGEEGVANACRLTPKERIRAVTQDHGLEHLFDELMAHYDKFLTVTQGEKESVLSRFADRGERDELTRHATAFGDLYFELLWKVARPPIKRYLVI